MIDHELLIKCLSAIWSFVLPFIVVGATLTAILIMMYHEWLKTYWSELWRATPPFVIIGIMLTTLFLLLLITGAEC